MRLRWVLPGPDFWHRLSGHDQASGELRLLQRGPRPSAFAAVPFLVFAAPFIIMRNTLRARRFDGRRFESVMVATVAAGMWSLMTGTVVVMALHVLRR